jgi:peptide/nickel transport system substrate-binding protein
VSWEPERRIALKRFPSYWNKPAQIDSVDYQIIPSLETKLQMLKKGELDIITGLSAASVDELYRQRDINVVAQSLLTTVVVGFNCQISPFNDVKVRQAIVQALDKSAIINSLSRGFSTVARGPLPPYAIGYDSTLTPPPFDPAAAKELLKSLGYQNGPAVKLGYISHTDTVRADPLSLAIQSYLGKIGVVVELVRYGDWQTYSKAVLGRHGKVHLFREGLPLYTRHPDNFLYSHFHSRSPHNYFHYQNSQVDQLLEQARQASDLGLQHQLYRKIQEILLQEAPAVFLSHPNAVCAARLQVKNFRIDPDVIPRMAEVKIE